VKIVIPGGSGQIGTFLADHFHRAGNEVIVLSRTEANTPWKTALWDGRTEGRWIREIDGADVVINLAGRSVDCRYHAANRREILDSRIISTALVGEAICNATRPPRIWLQASTATIYSHRYDAPNDDVTGILGGDEPDLPDTWRFSLDVAGAWEHAFEEAPTPHTRKVALRAAMTMEPRPGGVFATLSRLARFGLGGRAGDGRQYVSWIHYEDFTRAIEFLIDRETLAGPINLASPNPLPYADFMAGLRRAWGVPFGLPAPEWLLETATWLLRTESELVLKSRRVVPKRLLDAGFRFLFPAWPDAAGDLREQMRRAGKP
jgi:uncharacterized protein